MWVRAHRLLSVCLTVGSEPRPLRPTHGKRCSNNRTAATWSTRWPERTFAHSGLADRFSLIDPDLLAANKRITNLALELMGAQTLQRLAGENDARAHRSGAVRDYGRSVREHGLKETLHRRDAPFGEGFARVGRPEGRDASVRKAREGS